jgi:molybdenum cofactor biosynthesis protein B
MSKSTAEHRAQAPTRLNFALLTISTSRYRERKAGQPVDDPSGEILTHLLEEAEYTVVYRDVIPDDEDHITRYLKRIVQMPTVNVLITCGGTGITTTDVTIETITPLLEKELPGFGEIFRKLSYEIIGSAAIITRATAGILNGRVVFCLPGSPQAVELALTRLIIPEVGHLTKHAQE